jgi:hypothetical protein
MYHILNFDIIIFLEFIVHEMNSEIIKSGIVVWTKRENADVVVDWMLQSAAEAVAGERKREI